MMRFALLFAITFCLVLAFTWLLVFCRRRRSRSGHAVTTMCQHTGGPTCGSCRDQKVMGTVPSLRISGKFCRQSATESVNGVGVSAPSCSPVPPEFSAPQDEHRGKDR